ncbi:pectate lyase family protein [Pinibacter soli]|uniref:Pectate lyase n=1 Tax=Pinibacter soli TaxID=3044211 RepID=A0ABT6REY4_9BACT|nr:pectate lyase [Pinibacter soli]MDI3321117.1 pectate lyase [Pinibacter soli]
MKYIILASLVACVSLLSCDKNSNTAYSPSGGNNNNGGGNNNPAPVQETALAFPGAEGFGKNATGGRGGKVVYVTKLTDDGSQGTLRYAVQQTGARFVVFSVSGVIQLNSKLEITNGDLTIAGQTAPGDGICIRDYPMVVNADNVIIRYMRFRMGDVTGYEDDAFWGRGHKNIMIDHCSMSWSIDECSSWYDNQNFTMQWCILAESLRMSDHVKGAHGYGAIWGGQKASFHHNLMADHDSRNPRFCGSRYTNRPDLERVDFRNNVIFNWGANSGYAGEGGQYNMVNNYYKPGPESSNKTRIFQPYGDDGTNSQPAGVWGSFYVAGNVMNGSASVTSDNWTGVTPNDANKNKADLKLASAWDITGGEVNTQVADTAYDRIIKFAGASYKRDAVDTRVTGDVKSGTPTVRGSSSLNVAPYPKLGIIDSQKDVGNWPVYNSTTAPVSTASDGIPDDWKKANKLDVTKSVANGRSLSTGYDNIEVYINSLVKDITDAQK